MKDGICPKCGSDRIYVGEPRTSFLGVPFVGYLIVLAPSKGWTGKNIVLRRYGCANCGYIESYAADKESIQNMMEEWQPIKKKPKNDE